MRRLFDDPVIYLITKGEATALNFAEKSREIVEVIRLAVEERVSLVQIREKALPARLMFDLTVRAAAITRYSATRLLVNDRIDIAFAASADGVHLTSNSLSVDIVRRSFSRDLIIGVSTHSIEEAAKASENGADFAVFGPVFETPLKDEPQGTEVLSKICKKLRSFPILALGGVDEGNVDSVLESGARGFAAIRGLNDPDSLRSICRKLGNE